MNPTPRISLVILLIISAISHNLSATNPSNDNDVDKSEVINTLAPNEIEADLGMTNKKVEEILKRQGILLEGSMEGYWQLQFHNRILMIIGDETHNKMRIITFVVLQKNIKKSDYISMMEAQFDRSLDIKYAIFHKTLWSAYVHSLKEMTYDQFIDALYQVYYGASNYGSSYEHYDMEYRTGGR